MPPPVPFDFSGPVVVVGSAPLSHRPAGFNDQFSLITINGSQSVTSKWGRNSPDVTLMMFNQIEGTTQNAEEVRRVLSGQRTKALYVLLWRKDDLSRLERGLKSFNYEYEHLYIVDRYERMALLDKVVGLCSLELDAEAKCSNGVNAVLFALFHGAPAVIITGINPNSSGHVYNSSGLARLHVQMDRMILERLVAAGSPIFTSDPIVSIETGIPLWQESLSSPRMRRPASRNDEKYDGNVKCLSIR
jgi:hypothetical protein